MNDDKWLIAKEFDNSGPALVHPLINFKNKEYPHLNKTPLWFFIRPDGSKFRVDDEMKLDYQYRDGHLVTRTKIFDITGKSIFIAPKNYRIIDAKDATNVCILSPSFPNLPYRLVKRSTGQCYAKPFKFKTMRGFKEGMARFQGLYGSWGFIDRRGNVAFPATYNNTLSDFESGFYMFKNKKTDYLYGLRNGNLMLFH